MQGKAKSELCIICWQQEVETASDLHVMDILPQNRKRALVVSSEKGASSWLSILSMADNEFAIKGAFWDAHCLWYAWHSTHLPTDCTCGKSFSEEHAVSCPCEGFLSIQHNETHDLMAQFLTEVYCLVGTESSIQPLSHEQLSHKTVNREYGACVDVIAESF